VSAGKTVRLFLADGTPGGLLTAEIMNWTGHVVAAPRTALAELLKRREVMRTGVYILLGEDPDSIGGQMAYIGEGDDVSKRLYQHARAEDQRGKDFWDRAIVLTSKDMNLTKAHARYLESHFLTLAEQAGRARLVNGTSPMPLMLPEADVSDMEYFVEQAKIVLPVLGVNIFRETKRISTERLTDHENIPEDGLDFEMKLPKIGISAAARVLDSEFIVTEGSVARLAWTGSEHHSYRRLRKKLEKDGTLEQSSDGSTMYFTKDHPFASPSAAATVIAGRAANGRTAWILRGTPTTYGQWEEQAIDEAMDQSRVDI